MPTRKTTQRRTPEAIADELDAEKRLHLICIATGTSMAKVAGNRATIRSRLIIKGLAEREGSRIVITDQGRAVLAALLARWGSA